MMGGAGVGVSELFDALYEISQDSEEFQQSEKGDDALRCSPGA
jgi:hypothetical protein